MTPARQSAAANDTYRIRMVSPCIWSVSLYAVLGTVFWMTIATTSRMQSLDSRVTTVEKTVQSNDDRLREMEKILLRMEGKMDNLNAFQKK